MSRVCEHVYNVKLQYYVSVFSNLCLHLYTYIYIIYLFLNKDICIFVRIYVYVNDLHELLIFIFFCLVFVSDD